MMLENEFHSYGYHKQKKLITNMMVVVLVRVRE
jgi:hypothetical protein